MSCKLLVIVYDQDLPQFELMSYCLNKNWQGQKTITIVYQGDIESEVSSIVKQYFSQSWHVDIVKSTATNLSGIDLQQLDKVLSSLDDTVQDVIVFDCKDFLLKPIDETYFKRNGQYRITFLSDLFDEFYPHVCQAIGSSEHKHRAILNITPWIWNVTQLKKYWEYITTRYPINISSWTSFYPSSEIASYYYYTVELDSDPCLSFSEDLFMPTGGIWDNDNLEETLQVISNFDRYDSAVWKHHRRITDYSKTMITVVQLQKYNIPNKNIVKWVNDKHNLRS